MNVYPNSKYPLVPLEQCGEIITGSTPSKKKPQFWGGEIPFVTPSNLGFTNPVVCTEEKVTQEGADNGRLLPEGAVLVCCIGSLGKVGVAGVPLISNQQINAVVFNEDKANSRYGYHICKKLTPILEHFAPSTTIKIVKKSTFAKIAIPLPPLEQQKRIADILDAADALRVKRRQVLEQLDELVQSVFLEMFGDPVTYQNRFEVVQLEEACQKITDGEHGTVERQNSGRLYLMARNITNKKTIDLTEVSYISEEDYQRINRRCNVEYEDILLVCVGATIGKVAMVSDMEGFSLARSVALIKPNRSEVNPSFVLHFLGSQYGQFKLLGSTHTAAQAGLYLSKIRQLEVPLPPLELQNRFAEIVSAIEAQKVRVREHLVELDALFASLQQQAFSGEL